MGLFKKIAKKIDKYREYKQIKYSLKQHGVELKKRHGVYTLKFTQREGPTILLDLFTYTLTDKNLYKLLDKYNQIKKRKYERIYS